MTIKGGYYPSWDQNLGPDGIKTKHFTHIFYAFLNPNENTFQFNITGDEARKLRNFTSTLHDKRHSVKTLFAIGGASAGTAVFSRMASNASSRSAFIRSAIEVARTFGFDGVDLDWEYPSNQMEMEKFGSLLDEWRLQVQNEARNTGRAPLLLTAAVYFSNAFSWGERQVYPAASMNRNLDFINVMTYDYYGNWVPCLTATGAHAALYGPSPQANMSTMFGLESWIGAGVKKSKLIMGLPLYGRTWTLANPASHGIGARAVGVGPGHDGIMTYAEVVRFNDNAATTVYHDNDTGSVYSVRGSHWVTYDDTWSVRRKIEYAKSLGVGGHFFWDVCGDHEWTISKKASKSWEG